MWLHPSSFIMHIPQFGHGSPLKTFCILLTISELTEKKFWNLIEILFQNGYSAGSAHSKLHISQLKSCADGFKSIVPIYSHPLPGHFLKSIPLIATWLSMTILNFSSIASSSAFSRKSYHSLCVNSCVSFFCSSKGLILFKFWHSMFTQGIVQDLFFFSSLSLNDGINSTLTLPSTQDTSQTVQTLNPQLSTVLAVTG